MSNKGEAFNTVLTIFEAASESDWYFDSGAMTLKQGSVAEREPCNGCDRGRKQSFYENRGNRNNCTQAYLSEIM